jgi:OPT family oligopeptide transporter
MAPDRGSSPRPSTDDYERAEDAGDVGDNAPIHAGDRDYLAEQATQPQNFTLRGVLVGLAIGVVICFSNMYFGLQTGWVSGMAMPSALIGFAYFKVVARTLKLPFTPVENVLVQSVAGSVGTMPLGCGFVGVIPALNFLLKPEEGGPLDISLWRLIVWSVGICFFGVVFAVPLRREMIIREKLKFPSGTATALLIKVLHGEKESESKPTTARADNDRDGESDEARGLLHDQRVDTQGEAQNNDNDADWKAKIRLLIIAFAGSALYTVSSYFVPQLHDIPIFGFPLATKWLWTLNPSPAYVGQGIIMGPATTLHMLLGAIIGWGILSPLAKHKGWAPGPVSDSAGSFSARSSHSRAPTTRSQGRHSIHTPGTNSSRSTLPSAKDTPRFPMDRASTPSPPSNSTSMTPTSQTRLPNTSSQHAQRSSASSARSSSALSQSTSPSPG